MCYMIAPVMKRIKKKKAFTLVEILIAIFVSGLIISALYSFLIFFQNQFQYLKKNASKYQKSSSFLHELQKEIPKSRILKLTHKHQKSIIEYEINHRFKKIRKKVYGSQILWAINHKNKTALKTETLYQQGLKNYITNINKKRKILNTKRKSFNWTAQNKYLFKLIKKDLQYGSLSQLMIKKYFQEKKTPRKNNWRISTYLITKGKS